MSGVDLVSRTRQALLRDSLALLISMNPSFIKAHFGVPQWP